MSDDEHERDRIAEEAVRAAREAAERAKDEAERVTAEALSPENQAEGLRQLGVIYAALILIGVYIVQPFLVAPSLDATATISVIAFAVAIPLLAALVLVNRQETFRGRRSRVRDRLRRAIRSRSWRPSSASSPASGTSPGSPG